MSCRSTKEQVYPMRLLLTCYIRINFTCQRSAVYFIAKQEATVMSTESYISTLAPSHNKKHSKQNFFRPRPRSRPPTPTPPPPPTSRLHSIRLFFHAVDRFARLVYKTDQAEMYIF